MLNQSFTDAVSRLGRYVTEYQTCVLEVIMTDETAIIHLIPREIYEEMEDEDYDEE